MVGLGRLGPHSKLIDVMLRGRRVTRSSRRCAAAIGCVVLFGAATLGFSAATEDWQPAVPTYTREVAPILYKECTDCHRPGEIGPMSFLTYRDTRPWARAIRARVLDRSMPPWFADPRYGTFSNERRLTQKQIDTIVAWVDGDAPEGDAAHLPAAPVYADGWRIGTPDAMFTIPQEVVIPAQGPFDYQYFRVPTNFTEDMWVQAAEIRPSSREHVHHVVVTHSGPGPATKPPGVQMPGGQDAEEEAGRRGQELALFAARTDPQVFPLGAAQKIKAGSTLLFQIHYTPTGAPSRDRTTVGLVFAKERPGFEIHSLALMDLGFTIPPGAPNHRVDAEAVFTAPARIWSLGPHAHFRGKRFDYRLVYPDGRSEIVLSVPNYDFNWQIPYRYAEPLPIPAGTRLIATAHYDNSRANKLNPDPTATVRVGEQTTDEMMLTYVAYSLEQGPPPPPRPPHN